MRQYDFEKKYIDLSEDRWVAEALAWLASASPLPEALRAVIEAVGVVLSDTPLALQMRDAGQARRLGLHLADHVIGDPNNLLLLVREFSLRLLEA